MRYSLVLAFAVLSPKLMNAQTRDTTAVPRQVVVALLQGLSMSEVDAISIGALPAGFPRDLLPAEAKIVGSVDFGGAEPRRRSDAVIVELDAPPDSAIARIDKHLEQAGWKEPTFPQRERGGFVSTSYGPSGFAKLFCRGDRTLNTTATRTPRGSVLALSLSDSRRSVCDERNMERRTMRGYGPEIELPTLTPPSGVRMRGGGDGGGTGYRETTARIMSSHTPTFLLDYFAAQLKQQGWQSHGQVSTPHASALILTKRDKNGRMMQGTLTTAAR